MQIWTSILTELLSCILLPSKHHLSKLIVEHEHSRQLHGGTQSVLCAIREKFWILNGRNVVRGIIRKCIKCYKTKPVTLKTQMGDLPAARIIPKRPFSEVGIDFAGPVWIREGTTRSRKIVKCYICIFICFVTRAVHIDLANDLSTKCFLNVLKRFIARRGICQRINSDNGTNFVGTRNEIFEVFEFLEKESTKGELRNYLLENEITWRFTPPRSPHFGGLWEAAVKAAKRHLVKIMGKTHLTHEQFYTVLCQIEAVLNSRPITPLSTDPNDYSVLTPGHFLVGRSLTAMPERL